MKSFLKRKQIIKINETSMSCRAFLPVLFAVVAPSPSPLFLVFFFEEYGSWVIFENRWGHFRYHGQKYLPRFLIDWLGVIITWGIVKHTTESRKGRAFTSFLFRVFYTASYLNFNIFYLIYIRRKFQFCWPTKHKILLIKNDLF